MTGRQVRFSHGIEFKSAPRSYKQVTKTDLVTSLPLPTGGEQGNHTHNLNSVTFTEEADDSLFSCQACCAVVFESDIDKHAQYHTSNDEWYRPLPDDPTL